MSELTLAQEMTRERVKHLSDLDLELAWRWMRVKPEDIEGPPNGVLVGEAPGLDTSGALPLFPWPSSSSAGRLLKLSGLTPGQYLGRLERRNLFAEHQWSWDASAAAGAAVSVLDEMCRETTTRMVLLGTRVARAFGMEVWSAKKVWKTLASGERVEAELRAIPHPSGRSIAYNDEQARYGAQAAIGWAAGYV